MTRRILPYHWIFLVLAVVLNAILFSFDQRWDLTPDQRFTVSDQARDLITNNKGDLVITVLLHGNLPPDLRAYRDFIDHYLFELRRLKHNVTVVYKNPGEGSIDEVNSFRAFLNSRGITPISRRVSSGEEISQSFIYPFLSVHNNKDIIFVDLLSSADLNQSDGGILNSMARFEPKLITAIRDINLPRDHQIYITGSEADRLVDALQGESRNFQGFEFKDWNPREKILLVDSISALIVVDRGFDLDRRHLLMADQLLLKGVPVLWLVDKFDVAIDSIRRYGSFITVPEQNVSEDFLFKSGIKIAHDLLMDLNCSAIPQVIGEVSGQSRIIPVPYPYHPLFIGGSPTDLLHLSEPVSSFFVSPLDTVKTAEPIKKTGLVYSSPYTQRKAAPVNLEFNFLRVEPDPDQYNFGQQMVAVLLEGPFSSYFLNRLTSDDRLFLKTQSSVYNPGPGMGQQIVISDTDFILPFLSPDGTHLPIGYNVWDRTMYTGNRKLVLRALEYLVNGEEVLSLVKEDLSLRPLDDNKFHASPSFYFAILLGCPILVILLISFCYKYFRQHRYERKIVI